MAKKVTGDIKLQIPAGKATPAPPVGPALGQHGVTGNFLCHVRHLLNILWYGAAFSPAPAAGHCFHCSTDRSTERLCDRVLKRLI